MATGTELADIVLNIVKEDEYDDDSALYQFNQCAEYLSQKFIIPSLDQQGKVTTSTSQWSIEVPEDFQRNLYAAIDSNGHSIGILDSRKQILRYSGGDISRVGSRVERVAVVGDTLLHWPVSSSSEELTLFYQRKPSKITMNDKVSLLPGAFVGSDSIFINYACWKMFERIEQGLEGQKVDTQYYQALFIGLVDELELYLKKESGVSLPGPKVVRMQRW